ncbi:MAG: M18 family aminopeptidase [Myxococcales bacterium]|nr:M18 family aminopeptidase [Myxococcales bacterium]
MNDAIVDRFVSFLDASPTPHHAVATVASHLGARGFEAVRVADPPRQLPAGFRGYVRDEGSIFAFVVGNKPVVDAGFRVIAAHTDSPNLRVKPQPLQRSHGYVRLGVEVYGGVQVATWVDRDLGMAGVVHVKAGDSITSHLVDVRRPVARVPTLAIHLNRTVNSEGLKLNNQTQLPAVFALCDDDDGDPLRALLAAEVGCAPDDVTTWDLSLFDLATPTVGGANGEFVFSARLDNLGSCHAALEALTTAIDDGPVDHTTVVAMFDHEEIGSRTQRGAAGRALEHVMRTIMTNAVPQGPGTLSRALAHSFVISADMAHAVHPGFSDKSDAEHAPRMGAGPAIKLNVNQRYTSEGSTSAMFAMLCEEAEVPVQWFTTRADMACGSTVGPLLAAGLGVRAVDVGNPMLSMHSVREQCGSQDHGWMAAAMRRFLVRPKLG